MYGEKIEPTRRKESYLATINAALAE